MYWLVCMSYWNISHATVNLYIALVVITILSNQSGLSGYDCKDSSFPQVSFKLPHLPGDSHSAPPIGAQPLPRTDCHKQRWLRLESRLA